MAAEQAYIAAFDKWRVAKRHDPSWLRGLRDGAIESLGASGFPTTKQEGWRYTNLESVVSRPFRVADRPPPTATAVALPPGAFIEPTAPRLAFIDGFFAPELSSIAGIPAGVRAESLAELLQREDTVAAELGRHADLKRNPLVALNTAFVNDGAVIIAAPGVRCEQPIHVAYLSLGGSAAPPVLTQPRTIIVLGRASELTVVESYAGADGGSYFCNAVTELTGAADASMHHYTIKSESGAAFHTGTLAANMGQGSRLEAQSVILSGALLRNDVHVALAGEGAECVVNGLYLGTGKQHVDNFTEIEHLKPRATSLELYKGILDGAAHGIFNGKIVVHKDAQKTDARQTNRNLLLSMEAVVHTNPQLEIYADDVKCSHGSTIGQLDPDALFYLRSRGVGPEEARSVLSFAFASDIVQRMKADSLRRALEQYLAAIFYRHN
jgi:Fe-S cluster assembly protein SufD